MKIDSYKLGFEDNLSIEELIKIANRYVNNNYMIDNCSVLVTSISRFDDKDYIILRNDGNDKKTISLKLSTISFRNFEKNEVFNEIDEILKIINQEDK